LFKVEDTISIASRGLVLIPGINPIGEERFRVGDPLVLKRPDCTKVSAAILGGLELICPNPRQDVVIMLKGFSKEDVPLGTEVWST
jgi:hypothetical protein